MKSLNHFCSLFVLLLVFTVLLGMTNSSAQFDGKAISASRILENIRVLSSDEYEGRAPASRGETLTTKYIETQFKKVGLKPGNPDGTYFQSVPIMGIKADSSAELMFTNSVGKSEVLKFATDFVAWTKRAQPEINIEADVVFVGYGIEAPKYSWNDFKGVDVKGKIIVVLINDPPVPDPNDPSKLDEKSFNGKAKTFYGDWKYKYEKAAEKGALGCLIVHQADTMGYPWNVVRDHSADEQFSLVTDNQGMFRCAAEGFITYEKAKALFALAGQDFDALAKSAISRDFSPVNLHIKASLSLRNTIRTFYSKNVVGKMVGSDPKVRDEYVIYTAHWDHLGIGPEMNGDNIYHGAVDNASGVAGLIELADAFIHTELPPRRSILFLATTGEEIDLLGSQYYSEHPLYPLDKTLANINMDTLNMFGRTRGIVVVGLGQSTLDEVVQEVAGNLGREIKPDPEPEKGSYYRNDQFNFAKQGVPAIYLYSDGNYPGKPEGWGSQMCGKYMREDYHRPSDTIKPYWDLSGTVEDLRFFGAIGYHVANSKTFPEWKENSEFRSKRVACSQPENNRQVLLDRV